MSCTVRHLADRLPRFKDIRTWTLKLWSFPILFFRKKKFQSHCTIVRSKLKRICKKFEFSFIFVRKDMVKDRYWYTYFDGWNIRSKNTDREISRSHVFIILVVMRSDRFDAGFHKIPIRFVNMVYSGAWCTNEVIFLDEEHDPGTYAREEKKKKNSADRSELRWCKKYPCFEIEFLHLFAPFEFDFFFIFTRSKREFSSLRYLYILSRVSKYRRACFGVEFNKKFKAKIICN